MSFLNTGGGAVEKDLIIAFALIAVMWVSLFITLTWMLVLSVKRTRELEEKLMAKSFSEYVDVKNREKIAAKIDREIETKEMNFDSLEPPLGKDEVE